MRHLLILMGVALPIGCAFAQTSGEITGEVHDQSGAAAPNASITVVNTGTSASRSTTTNEAGIYNVSPAQRAPYPEYAAGIELTEGGGRGNYNALGIKLTQRFSYGLTTLISYTWSKALDDGSAIRGTGITGAALDDMYPENPLYRRCEKGHPPLIPPSPGDFDPLRSAAGGKGKAS